MWKGGKEWAQSFSVGMPVLPRSRLDVTRNHRVRGTTVELSILVRPGCGRVEGCAKGGERVRAELSAGMPVLRSCGSPMHRRAAPLKEAEMREGCAILGPGTVCNQRHVRFRAPPSGDVNA